MKHTIKHNILLLVLSFAPRGFSLGTSVFPSPQKPTFPNSNSTRNQVDEEPLCGCATSKSLFIYLIYLFIFPTDEGTISSLEQNDHVKYLGVMIDDKISRKYHISFFSSRISRNSGIFFKFRNFSPFQLGQ